ncbi:glycoside hydrolase family 19 protein [Flavobacterium praedii]|uniref:glycoside hydrolase family 19 protein n=1 Tax=Flavobacterium praedii TaxID=3002900 RepID=UPI002481E1C5|nr:glycoside hydrolase family 19 protein [Flavobacterium praedii]
MVNFISINSGSFFNSLKKYGITSPLRIAHFFGQLAVESANFTANVEKISYALAQKKYQNHRWLGNKKEGDGYRFRGRGLIQLTGRYNYQRYKDYSGVDVVNHPELAAELINSIDIACWYWVNSPNGNLNKLADKDSVLAVTEGVNGGHNGLPERKKATAYFKAQNITLEELKKKVKPAVFNVKPTVWSWFNNGNNNIFYKK